MASRNKPCCCEMAALRAEIDRRARSRGTAGARALGRAADSPHAGVPTAMLIRRLRDSQRAIYGTDDRRDLYEVTRPELRKVADSVVALVAAADLHRKAGGGFRLSTSSYRDDYELCAGETFADQPLGCDCTGFLVAPDVIATAGHCARSTRRLKKIRFVFGFRMLDARHARTEFAPDDVYEGIQLMGREEDDDTGSDWALVRLSRPVRGRAPLHVRAAGKIADRRAVFVVGHPNGLPAKLADGAHVRDNRRKAFFRANLDTYGGNSGSPVFDARTLKVEGILVRGEDDFVKNGDCYVSLVCPDAGCEGESVTRSTVWAGHIAS
jgi:hypothetical protein